MDYRDTIAALMENPLDTGRDRAGWWILLFLAIIPVHFFCFYWLPAHSYYFTGDGLYYFSRQIHSFAELATRFLSVDEMYQYRPLTYVVFSFVLSPLFGSSAPP